MHFKHYNYTLLNTHNQILTLTTSKKVQITQHTNVLLSKELYSFSISLHQQLTLLQI